MPAIAMGVPAGDDRSWVRPFESPKQRVGLRLRDPEWPEPRHRQAVEMVVEADQDRSAPRAGSIDDGVSRPVEVSPGVARHGGVCEHQPDVADIDHRCAVDLVADVGQRLEGIDLDVLEELVAESVALMKSRHEC